MNATGIRECGGLIRRGLRYLGVFMLCFVTGLSASAHTFTTITADILAEDGEVSLTVVIHALDAIAIITNSPTTVGKTLTYRELRAGLPQIQAYLEQEIVLQADGKISAGKCLGFIPDLAHPVQSGQQLEEAVPENLPFLLVWTIPPDSKEINLSFNLLLDVVGSGIVHATLHRQATSEQKTDKKSSENPQGKFIDLGGNATFTLVHNNHVANDEETVASSSLSTWQLLTLGFSHIVPEGLDHILFVVCLFLLSPTLKPLLIQVTAFTVAHSLTLACAMLGWILLPSRLIETIIALSIVVMAVENMVVREVKPWRWIFVFIFGLIHGLGFAGSFSQLHLSSDDMLRPLFVLNIGIEIGQLAVVLGCVAVTWWAWKKPWYTPFIVIPASGGIAALALWWTFQRALGW
jgi:hydrogenase/urease accessory protein HupE